MVMGGCNQLSFRYGSRMRTLIPLLFLFACSSPDGTDGPDDDTGTDTDGGDTDVGVDADGDKFFGKDDCDDTNNKINPDATERCNGIDDDCDGAIDEYASDKKKLNTDADRDGFGVTGMQTLACPGTPGLVENTDDCDDTDPATYPGAPEDDCDDPTDRNCDKIPPTADQDGDSVPGCDDCDDTNDRVFPGALSVCDDCDDATVSTPIFESNFSEAPAWLSINGDASADGTALQLTLNEEDSAGTAIFTETVSASTGLEIEFVAEMCCRGGDDGITLAFLSEDTPIDGVGSWGGALGFLGIGGIDGRGYAIGLDTWQDTNEQTDNGVILLGEDEIYMDHAHISDLTLDDGEPHLVNVKYAWEAGLATVSVSVGGKGRLTTSFPQADVPIRLGFTGATSATFHEYQSVDDVRVGLCE